MVDILSNIKKLRDKTGISIIDCKKALLATNNDIEEAIVYLRKNGASIVESKASRQVNNGVLSFLIGDNKKDCVVVEVNCETDFVAKSNDFLNYVNTLCSYFLSEKFLGQSFFLSENDLISDKYICDLKIDIVSKLRENIVLKGVSKFFSIDAFFFGYVHFDNKSCVILNIDKDDYISSKDILIQIASMKPKYLSISDISSNSLSSEKQIAFDKLKNKYPDKNDLLLSKMVDGQINKFYSENVLLEQNFVKDSKVLIKDIIKHKFNIIFFKIFTISQN